MALDRTTQRRIIDAIEQVLNAEIPGTPRIGGRVRYVALPGKGRNRANLSRRANQAYQVIARRKGGATTKAIQSALRVTRNSVAGAVHELKQLNIVRAMPIDQH
jgi:hypothetical protein